MRPSVHGYPLFRSPTPWLRSRSDSWPSFSTPRGGLDPCLCADLCRRARPWARLRIELPRGRSPSACPRRACPAVEAPLAGVVLSRPAAWRAWSRPSVHGPGSAASPVAHGANGASLPLGRATIPTPFCQRPQIRRDDPLNLSISVSGGKETNQDSPSSGERRGKSPAPNPCPTPRAREMWRTEDRFPGGGGEPKSL